MDKQRSAESKLSIAYSLCVVLGATASITSGIAWGHWKDTLNQCAFGRNCSCILYGEHTPTIFVGGHASSCIWVTFGPLVYILICVGLACFHGFRVLFGSTSTTRRTVTTKNHAGETVVLQTLETGNTSPLPQGFWIVTSIITVFFTIYSLVHFSIFIDGFLTTCRQYRRTLEKLLGLHGTIIPVVHGRLACNAIFDFMDYIQPDTGNAYREGFINTAADLIIGIIASFFSWVFFLFAAILNIKFAKIKT